MSSGSTSDEMFVGSWRAHQIVAEILSAPQADQDRIIEVACGDDGLLRSRVIRIISSIESMTRDVSAPGASEPSGEHPSRGVASSSRDVGAGLMITRKIELSATRETWLGCRRGDRGSRILIHIFPRKTDSFDEVVAAFKSSESSSVEQLVAHGVTMGGRSFVAFNIVDGVPIHEYLGIFTTSEAQREVLFDRIRNAIVEANNSGLHHQNITRDSIMISEIDGKPFPTIVGLGLHRLAFECAVTPADCDQLAVDRILLGLEPGSWRRTAPVLAVMKSCVPLGSGFDFGSSASPVMSRGLLASSNHVVRQAVLGVTLLLVMCLVLLFDDHDSAPTSAIDRSLQEAPSMDLGFEGHMGLEGDSVRDAGGATFDDDLRPGVDGDHVHPRQGSASLRMPVERESARIGVGGGDLDFR